MTPLDRTRALVRRYVDLVVEHDPVEATRLGDHSRDAELPDLAPAAVDARARALRDLLREVERAEAELDGHREARGDLDLLRLRLQDELFWFDRWPQLERDPIAVIDVASSALHELLRRTDVDDATRAGFVRDAVARTRRLPRLFEQAGRLLVGAPPPHLLVAEQRLAGLQAMLEEELPARADAAGVDRLAVEDAVAVALEGVAAFGAFLRELEEAPRPDWRLGSELHRVRLGAALGADMPPETIASRAREAIARRRAELVELTGRHWEELAPGRPRPADDDRQVLEALAAIASTALEPHELLDTARSAIDEAYDFTRDAAIVDVPPADLLDVVEAPKILRGVAVAFITEPPPLEDHGRLTYYLAPAPREWSEERRRSYLREYNPSQLRSLALHEGLPGHFVQLAHAGRHPRLARRLLGSPAFAEGWAVYAERRAAEAGFGDPAYRVTHAKLELRIAANAVLDVGLHAGGLAEEEAVALLTEEALQEEAEAEGKLVRAQVTSGQLSSYFVGGAGIDDLRAEVERREGPDFDARAFHQRLLSHGTPTLATAREALRDPEAPVRRPFA